MLIGCQGQVYDCKASKIILNFETDSKQWQKKFLTSFAGFWDFHFNNLFPLSSPR